MAMSLYTPGDYGPRARLRPLASDSLRWQTLVWTDLRQQPLYGRPPALDFDDRNLDLFGLQVRTTYQLSATRKDVLLVRFDVTNISDQVDWRQLHVGAPVGGITPRDIYLAPVVDADIGVSAQTPVSEIYDDNATLFPADSLMMAFDGNFAAPSFGAGTTDRPGLVGLRLVSAPAPAKGLVAEFDDDLDFLSPLTERNSYRILAAGRAGAAATSSGCTDRAGTVLGAYVCAPDAGNNVLMGWSVGPIAALAPGQTTTLVVALLMAYPKEGEFTSGTVVLPQNDQLDATTTRQIWRIAEPLRTLGAQLGGSTVSPTR